MSVTGFPFLSCTLNLNSIATPDFSGPDGRFQIIFPPSEVCAIVKLAAADAEVIGGPIQAESSEPNKQCAVQSSVVVGRSNSPTNVQGNPRRSTMSAKIL